MWKLQSDSHHKHTMDPMNLCWNADKNLFRLIKPAINPHFHSCRAHRFASGEKWMNARAEHSDEPLFFLRARALCKYTYITRHQLDNGNYVYDIHSRTQCTERMRFRKSVSELFSWERKLRTASTKSGAQHQIFNAAVADPTLNYLYNTFFSGRSE